MRTLLVSLLLLTANLLTAQFTERLNFGAKFEPVGTVLHGAGQSEEFALASYAAALPPEQFPTIYMAYVPSRADDQRRERTLAPLRDIARYYPEDIAFQIGVSMTTGSAATGNSSYTTDIVNGVYDENIDAIARSLDSLNRDIFVRIGYEANGFWNGYRPETYVPAFRYVADRMRAISDRIATVWCTHSIDPLSRMMQFYPGDEYVDWWAIDLFQPRFLRNQAVKDFLAEAIEREKPVMIGESTPTMVGVGNGAESWNAWYAPYFQQIRDNPGIKAFCYINRDWRYISSLSDWGNTLIQTDSIVQARYREEMTSPLYQHLSASEDYETAIVRSVAEEGTAVAAEGEFTIGNTPDGPLNMTLTFDLDTLMNDSIRAVKLWLVGRNGQAEDRPLRVVTPDGTFLGEILVNDRGRNKINWVDVTAEAAAAAAAGRSTISVTFGLPEDGNTFTFHSMMRADGYPPALQVVYAERTQEPNSVFFGNVPPTIPLTISPNPSMDVVRLGVSEQDYTLEIVDTTGRLVLRRAGLSGEQQLNVRPWPAGVYHLRLTTGDGRIGTGRVVRR